MKIAIIGSGISGMTAAHLLSEDHEVTLFEANDYIGGHTHTVDVVSKGRRYPVDTGFIVFNANTYPNFIKLMTRLKVPWQNSVMSFSVQCEKTGLVFSPSSLNSLFIQRRNLFRPSFYRMLWDIHRFKRDSETLLAGDSPTPSLADYLTRNRYSQGFINHFIVPMGAAIWSADPEKFNDFPAAYFARFFKNHGILNIKDQPQWLTIRGGSRQYIAPLVQPYRKRIRLNCAVSAIRRGAKGVEIQAQNCAPESYDEVVIATHSDQALRLLADPSEAEQKILGRIPYQENITVLHSDASLMPRQRAAWASWNYHIPRSDLGRVAVTYNMNILQSLDTDHPFCVSLNRVEAIDPRLIHRHLTYHHPVYDKESMTARKSREVISGVNRTHYCGAYWGYGFHEDGVNSALEVCRRFGKDF